MSACVALAASVGIASAAAPAPTLGAPAPTVAPPPSDKDWSDPIKQPTPWFKWGADLRLRQEYMNNSMTLNSSADYHELNYNRYRFRLWGTAWLPDQKAYELSARFTWEGRHWYEPETRTKWQWADGMFDNLFIKATKPGNLPITATVGRQDMKFAEGWLICDGTPLDGSRTMFFDAARLQVDIDRCKTEANFIFIEQKATPVAFMHFLGNRDTFLTEQNERGGIIYLINRAFADTRLDAYGIYKHNDSVLPNGDNGDIYAIGGRFERKYGGNILLRAEGAYECGSKNGNGLSAYGANTAMSFLFNDPAKNVLSFEYEFCSGDDPGTATNEQFDLLWGRWPRWSEMLIYTYATETRVAETTNLHRGTIAWDLAPMKGVEMRFDYSLLFANQNTLAGNPGFDNGGDFRGQLFRAIFKYTFNKHLDGHLWGEYFLPGNYYSDQRHDPAVFLRAQINLTL